MSDPIAFLNEALEGRYRIEGELGQGGMATVYLAADLRHERQVALKVLKPELTAVVGATRFLAEIKTTANLQHPHILPLFDSGEAGPHLFYVMPRLEGETLQERIARERQLPIDEAVRIASAVAHALDYAHRHGVIHRDVKPENILLHDGEPVVADFGIALAVGSAGAERITETGLSLGTPYYMSPEQATGDQSVGPPADIYALGCVLYEMLVGEPPYMGSTAQAVLGRIISGGPVSATNERPTVPPNVDAAVRCALEKLPADRFVSAEDFRRALEDPGFRYGSPAALILDGGAKTWRRGAATFAAVTMVLGSVLTWMLLTPTPPDPVVRYGVAFAPGEEMVDEANRLTFDIARDGAWIAYVGPGQGGGQLWIKRTDQYHATPLAGTDGARAPSISPDGEWIAFSAGGRLRKIPSGGGAAITLVDSVAANTASPVAWLDDGTLAYITPLYHLARVPWGGGQAEDLLAGARDGPNWFGPVVSYPLPDSRGILVGQCLNDCSEVQELWVLDLLSGEVRQLVGDAVWASYLPTGHILYVRRDGVLFVVPFDSDRLEVTGTAVRVLDGVRLDDGRIPDLVVSAEGTLMYRPTYQTPVQSLGMAEAIWINREGYVRPVDPGWRFQNARNWGWSLSPDGTRLAIGLAGEEGDDIWIKDLDDGPLTRLTDATSPVPSFAEDARPAWSRDGESVMFFSGRAGDGSSDLYVKRADGARPAELILAEDETLWTVHPSGTDEWWVLQANSTGGDIRVYRPGTDSASLPLLCDGDYEEYSPVLSPDGRFLAYVSDESGQFEVYVRPFPDVEAARWRVSSDGGQSPVWANSGRELFYIAADRSMIAATVDTRPQFRVLDQEVLFDVQPEAMWVPGYTIVQVTPDDQRFLMVRRLEVDRAPEELIVVLNWFEELKRVLSN